MPILLQKIRSGLVELRTNRGLVYASPAFWERIYLLWTFRNFHRLPQQVLNRRQRQLIEKLRQSAMIVLPGRIAQSSVIGAVENIEIAPEPKTAVASAAKLITMSAPLPAALKAVGSEQSPAIRKNAKPVARFPGPGVSAEPIRKAVVSLVTHTRKSEPGPAISWPKVLRKRIRLRAAIATGCVFAAVSMLLYFRQARSTSSATVAQIAKEVQQPASQAGSDSDLPETQKMVVRPVEDSNVNAPRRAIDQRPLVTALQEPIGNSAEKIPHNKSADVEASALPRLHVSEGPESGFTYPAAPGANLTGSVVLTAIIGVDGKVTSVNVVKGNPLLAKAAAKAVRHWQYSPRERDGRAVEAETNVVVTFLGEDAVSVSFPAEEGEAGEVKRAE